MKRLTFDRDRCLACRSCELACAVAHSASGALLPALDEQPAPRRRVSLALGPRGIAALRCAQCDEPLCVFSCKSGALYRSADGGVHFDESRCVGCLMCYMVCALLGVRSATPTFFTSPGVRSEIPTFFTSGTADPTRGAHAVPVRCDVCAGREMPACVEACPTKALGAGESRPATPWAATGGRPCFAGHVVVIGSSAAGIAACEAAREMAPDCRITLITADAEWYSRPLLPYVLSGRVESEHVAWRAKEYLAGLGVDVITRSRATELRADKKIVVSSPGPKAGTYDQRNVAFDRLIIATGASATKLTVPGSDLEGVHVLRDLSDLEAIAKMFSDASVGARIRLKPDSTEEGPGPKKVRAVVVGGGNVGLQTAEALARRGARVTVVVKSPHLLSQMVDEEAGRRLAALFVWNGVEVRTGRDVAAIIGKERVQTVRLDDGHVIEADLVIVGKGIQPNVDWLRSSGVAIGRGVMVDRSGRTNVDGIFAAGDCAEVDDPIAGQSIVSGIWPIAYEMGRAAGAAAVGAERPSAGALRMNSSRFFDTPVISIGEPRAERVAGATEHIVAARDDVYRKLVMKEGRLIGAVLFGDISDAGLYYRMYRDGVDLAGAEASAVERDRVRWIAFLAEQVTGASPA